ncbi:hypothetical protein [Actinocrispum wychmicini]|uniref:Uncharacterized protein n=1 Tax=Actinocrispum wychmicini TaxID=1213861 RepID=A0A4R2IVK7_9PSEU|nr:hypothetical protein [Actinocrispum wychmicini]TCO49663.1 hypothetical protein EV192_11428 [Actinocrispum wychmicini]
MSHYARDVAERWVAAMTYDPDMRLRSTSRMYPSGDRIYSYGSHFELGRVIRRAGEVVAFLLNGDTYSPTTSNHQNELRSAVDRSGVPRVIIPYSALQSSGLDLDSIEILDVTRDAWVPVERVAYQPRTRWAWSTPGDLTTAVLPDGRTRYRWTDYVHRLGESVIRGRIHIGWRSVGPDRWDRTPRYRWTKFLSGFDVQESRPLYFFCELPRTDATTVSQAYQALKPDAVLLAEQMNRTVTRQGDIFTVALSSQVTKRWLRHEGATFDKGGPLLDTNHVATEVARMPDGTTVVRGTLTHRPPFRRPDHRRVRLADGWHAVVKNTVPLSA